MEERVVIARVDDADLFTSGENSERKMQKIASCCVKLYEATGRKVEKSVCVLLEIER